MTWYDELYVGESIVPVSYTHLDVYKRQEQNKELLINKAKLEASLEDALLGKVTEKDKTEE